MFLILFNCQYNSVNSGSKVSFITLPSICSIVIFLASYKLISIKTDSYYNDNKLISIILDNFDFDLTNFYERLSIMENLDTYNWSLEKENLMLEVI